MLTPTVGPWVGTFEAHLTVETDDLERRIAFEALCGELGVKCVLIELAAGVHRAQPMTASHHRGAIADVAAEIDTLRARLAAAGFPVIRVKLEALLGAEPPPVEDPVTDPHGYFEFHAKIRIASGAETTSIGELAARHGAHLSRNDRKRDAGSAERFVTLRVYRAPRHAADAAFDALCAALVEMGYPPINTKREYTIYDGHLELDAGWLDR